MHNDQDYQNENSIKSMEEYIKYRLDYQIEWYDKKACDSQKKYKLCQIIELMIAAMIPLLSGYVEKYNDLSFAIGVGGAIITVIEGIGKLCKYHENWIEYRSTCELLRHEKYLYQMKAFPYGSEETPNQLFVKNVESIISSESAKWTTSNKTILKDETNHQPSTDS